MLDTVQYNSPEWFAESRQAHNDKVTELATLFNIYKGLIPQPGIGYGSNITIPPTSQSTQGLLDLVDGAIRKMMHELYPVEEHKEPVLPTITEVPRVHDSVIDEVLSDNKYFDWDTISISCATGNRVTRKKWDNTINQEYIEHKMAVGFIKYYKTASMDGYFKNVEHSYRPTEEDKEATDWYIL